MPEAERNTDVPSQEYGEGSRRAAFQDATSPVSQPPSPVAQPVVQNQLDEFDEPEADVEQVLGQGDPLGADFYSVLSEPHDAPDDLDAFQDWGAWLDAIASQPGAPESIRTVADRVRRRFS